jgi:hypothetical protein
MMADWENQREYLIKKYFECSLDQLCEANANNVAFMIEGEGSDGESNERLHAFINELHALLDRPDYFTARQKQVLSLMLGWHGRKYIGARNISEISKILKLAQPVIFNHYKLIVKKLKTHFSKDTEI